MQTRYNYVFLNYSEDYHEPTRAALKDLPFVKVYKHAFDGHPILQKLFMLHWSEKINRWIRLPLKSIWYRRMCKQHFDTQKPICYIFLGGKYITQDEGLRRYILRQNPQNKCIVKCGDLITKKNWNIEKIRQCCDHIVTYDKGEAQRFSIACMNEPCYAPMIEVTTPQTFSNDLYFLGYAKNRLPQIHSLFRYLSERGVRCKFIVCGVPEAEQIKAPGLIYSKPISYIENLKNVRESRCILEIMQGGSNSSTLRLEEAQVFRRKLLTNHVEVCSSRFFDPLNMRTFSEETDIDISFLKEEIDYASFEGGYDYSAQHMMAFYEQLLSMHE